MNENNSENLIEEESSEVTSEETSEESSEITSEGNSEEVSSEIDYTSILETMSGSLDDHTETLTELSSEMVETNENIVATNTRLDHVVTFLFIFACAIFIFYIWRILNGLIKPAVKYTPYIEYKNGTGKNK